ncbi:MAG: hypothetical protein ACYDFT_04590 [Thermoplasmata archaeon]
MTWGEIGLDVLAAGGFPLSGAANWTWDVQTSTGANVASASGGVEAAWSGSGSAAVVTTGETIVLTVPSGTNLSGVGDALEALGTPPFTGSVDASIP